ncbi:hypothetical protein NHH03_16260 [Stieleria sp. TO1_6]|uniref:hypothetical protein n=1 Tax=Stieleria tagensis TaxID=2956795 RepID=UPI00209B03C5|nr:hypothetical protein [Stieleria tagensis]MCO8123304.1 hypothetical protein [Stieleria tagensis]
MLIAEIRRKLSDIDDFDLDSLDSGKALRELLSSRKEDLLTADVFGALKYLPRQPYLETLFRTIQTANTHASSFAKIVDELEFGESDFKFHFWPNYATPVGLGSVRTEPDVEITGPGLKLFVEAKLHSDFGAHQIERQLLIGLVNAKPDENFFMLLVTKGAREPRICFDGKRVPIETYLGRVSETLEIADSLRDQLANGYKRILWINWRRVVTTLKQCHREEDHDRHSRGCRDMVNDLVALMEMRSMAPFHGISGGRQCAEWSRPVVAAFLGGEGQRKRNAFRFENACHVDFSDTTGFVCPRPSRRNGFNLDRTIHKWELPVSFGWRLRSNLLPVNGAGSSQTNAPIQSLAIDNSASGQRIPQRSFDFKRSIRQSDFTLSEESPFRSPA